MRLPLTRPVELAALTREMKAVVPELAGLGEQPTALIVTPLTRQFTSQEEAAITQAYAVHDALAIRQANASRTARRVAAPQAIKNSNSLPALRQAVMDLHGIE